MLFALFQNLTSNAKDFLEKLQKGVGNRLSLRLLEKVLIFCPDDWTANSIRGRFFRVKVGGSYASPVD